MSFLIFPLIVSGRLSFFTIEVSNDRAGCADFTTSREASCLYKSTLSRSLTLQMHVFFSVGQSGEFKEIQFMQDVQTNMEVLLRFVTNKCKLKHNSIFFLIRRKNDLPATTTINNITIYNILKILHKNVLARQVVCELQQKVCTSLITGLL